ncbi:hypothetical protein GCM10018785_08170 [Streptomyces longispororuber]|uniref:DUF5133 domain-containing protein n=1 Tax=Streptomyces longispororuber TaxID=68230 RepID=A0A918Z7V8_9ACTN|nr:hypothetical protein GCM10018785_08170 [Streptomyces longispororuber]
MDTVLMPDPKQLRVLLARYADLRIAAPPTEANRRALEDVSYTLCVLTGATTIEDALGVADALLAGEPVPRCAGPAPARASSTPRVRTAGTAGRARELPLPRPSASRPAPAPVPLPSAKTGPESAVGGAGGVSLAV